MTYVCAAGLVQAIFTVSVLIFFIPIYYNFYLSLLWQVRSFRCTVRTVIGSVTFAEHRMCKWHWLGCCPLLC